MEKVRIVRYLRVINQSKLVSVKLQILQMKDLLRSTREHLLQKQLVRRLV